MRKIIKKVKSKLKRRPRPMPRKPGLSRGRPYNNGGKIKN